MEHKFDELIDGYLQNKAGVCNDFLNDVLTEHLRKRLELLHMQDELSPAGIGKGISKVYDLQIRSDKIYWIDKTSADSYELELVNIVEEFISYLNRTCYTGINDYSEYEYEKNLLIVRRYIVGLTIMGTASPDRRC